MNSLASLHSDIRRIQIPAFIAGVAGFALMIVGYSTDDEQFFRSYLYAYMFWIGIPLGSLALLMLQYQTGGAWAFPIRRLLEAASRMLPVMAILFIPVLFGIHNLYHWSHEDAVAKDKILQAKSIWLNTRWFIIRAVIYFAIWIVLAMLLSRWSRREDQTGDPVVTRRMRILSAPGIFLYVATMTLVSVDWIMSIDPHWYSTIFGLIFIAGQVLTTIAAMILLLALLFQYDPLAGHVGRAHFADLGNLMLAFVLLWAYMAFSQYLIIWSGNIKEETPYYIARTTGGVKWVALFLVVFHFFVPFLLLLWRTTKRSIRSLATLAVVLLVLRFVDLHWTIMPLFLQGLLTHSGDDHHHTSLLHWMDFIAPIAIGGIWIAVFCWQLRRMPLLPLHDYRLHEISAAHEDDAHDGPVTGGPGDISPGPEVVHP